MTHSYKPPVFQQSAFDCPLCRVYSAQTWWVVFATLGNHRQIADVTLSLCAHCNKDSVWVDGVLVHPPVVMAPDPHPDLPEDCRPDFEEARAIVARSPRGAAALLRLVTQKLMPHLGEPGKDLNADIKALVVKGLPIEVSQALDSCRVVGNNSVHPGEMSVIDEPTLVQELFNLINFIVEDRIYRPKQIAGIFGKLPQGARDAIAKRDA